MIIIFYLSNQSGDVSSNKSMFIFNKIRQALNIDLNTINILHNIAREMMHFVEYFILELLLIWCLYEYNIKDIFKISIMIMFIYSVGDEIHQIFIQGRTFEYLDILLDIMGSLVAVLVIYLKNKNNKYLLERV